MYPISERSAVNSAGKINSNNTVYDESIDGSGLLCSDTPLTNIGVANAEDIIANTDEQKLQDVLDKARQAAISGVDVKEADVPGSKLDFTIYQSFWKAQVMILS